MFPGLQEILERLNKCLFKQRLEVNEPGNGFIIPPWSKIVYGYIPGKYFFWKFLDWAGVDIRILSWDRVRRNDPVHTSCTEIHRPGCFILSSGWEHHRFFEIEGRYYTMITNHSTINLRQTKIRILP
jgi:hypothetical protein